MKTPQVGDTVGFLWLIDMDRIPCIVLKVREDPDYEYPFIDLVVDLPENSEGKKVGIREFKNVPHHMLWAKVQTFSYWCE